MSFQLLLGSLILLQTADVAVIATTTSTPAPTSPIFCDSVETPQTLSGWTPVDFCTVHREMPSWSVKYECIDGAAWEKIWHDNSDCAGTYSSEYMVDQDSYLVVCDVAPCGVSVIDFYYMDGFHPDGTGATTASPGQLASREIRMTDDAPGICAHDGTPTLKEYFITDECLPFDFDGFDETSAIYSCTDGEAGFTVTHWHNGLCSGSPFEVEELTENDLYHDACGVLTSCNVPAGEDGTSAQCASVLCGTFVALGAMLYIC